MPLNSFYKEGIFNENVAQRFREHILSKGGSAHSMQLYERFRGKSRASKPS